MTTSASTRRQHLTIRTSEEQMEMQPDSQLNTSALSEDFEGKLKFATEQLESLQKKQTELEEQRRELQELSLRKEDFLNRQLETTERLTSALTGIDRELFEMRQEVEDLEQTRNSFATNLEKIEKHDPQNWRRDDLKMELEKAISTLDQAEDEYNEAVEHFTDSRSRLFTSSMTNKRFNSVTNIRGNELITNFKIGLAFNLPLIIAGIIAVILYLNR